MGCATGGTKVPRGSTLTTQAASVMPGWLAGLPRLGGYVCISDARRFAHDESKYDEQYSSDPGNMKVGQGLIALLRECGADTSGPALEIGCGTGLLSLGLAVESPYPLTILTDPSPAFLRLTEDKVKKAGVNPDRVCFALLKGEEVDRLPESSLSLIALRSTLHHILDVDEFIANAARALKPGGVLTFEEPCLEGYILMGAMIQFLPTAARAAGKPLTEPQEQAVDLFVRTMAFYARRDLDKTQAEDKHLFRVDELMNTGARCGLTVEFKPNRAYESFLEPKRTRGWGEVFMERLRGMVTSGIVVQERRREEIAWYRRFMRSYAKYCMSWDDGLVAAFDEFMPQHCRFVEDASMGTNGPYLHGVFVCRKTGR